MSPTDRAIRIACRVVVVVWIAAFLGWRDLAPREERVPVKTTSLEAHALPPPEPEPEPDPEPEIESEIDAGAEPAEPEPPEPETRAEAEPPEPETRAEAEPDAAPAERVGTNSEPSEVKAAAELERPEVLANARPAPAPEPEPAPETRAPERPEAEPAASADPPPSRSAPLEALDVPPIVVDEADVVRGGTLLEGEGGFPALESRYEGYGSFHQYANAMQRLGARFVVVSRREIVGTIDPWSLETGSLSSPGALSPRARDFAGEPELLRAGRSVRRRYGPRAQVMMLVPRRLDAGLFGGIARALEARGQPPTSYRQIRARYERGPGGSLRLRVEAAVRRDGREDSLPLLFDLDRLAGRTRS